MERRLAAILAADVVGYSRLMAEDESTTLERLNRQRERVLEPLIAGHAGRVVKLMGDGMLVEFGSVVEAVECAIAIRQQLTDSGDPLVQRIGVNLGDVIVEGEDIHGDGVNIAARLQTLAQPAPLPSRATPMVRYADGLTPSSAI